MFPLAPSMIHSGKADNGEAINISDSWEQLYAEYRGCSQRGTIFGPSDLSRSDELPEYGLLIIFPATSLAEAS